MNQSARLNLMSLAVILLTACDNQKMHNTPAATAPALGNEITVKIGHASPITGPNAHLGRDVEYGARLAIDDLNAEKLTIGGDTIKFKLISEDDQASPKISIQVAQRLVDSGIVGVVGHLNSGTTIPASRVYTEANLPQISPAATATMYTKQGFKTAFRVIANDSQQGSVIGAFVVNVLKAKQIAIIDDRTVYGQNLADEFEKAVTAHGSTVIKREITPTANTNNFKTVLTSIQKTASPDVIFYGGVDSQAALLARQMKQLGIQAKLIGGDGQKTLEFIRLAGDAAEGQYASSCGRPHNTMPGFAAFNRKFKNKFHTEVQGYAPYEYDALYTLVEAMKRADSTDPKRYLTEVGKVHFTGITGDIAFDNNGDLKNSIVTIYQVKGGKWEAISTVENERR